MSGELWTTAEDETILQYYDQGIEVLMRHFANGKYRRTDRAVYRRAWALGVSVNGKRRRKEAKSHAMQLAQQFHQIEMAMRAGK